MFVLHLCRLLWEKSRKESTVTFSSLCQLGPQIYTKANYNLLVRPFHSDKPLSITKSCIKDSFLCTGIIPSAVPRVRGLAPRLPGYPVSRRCWQSQSAVWVEQPHQLRHPRCPKGEAGRGRATL